MSLIPIPSATETMLNEVGNSSPAMAIPAVAACCKAWKRVFRAALAEDTVCWIAARSAGEAYRAAMPPLTNRKNCRDFVACVTHGILIGAIPEKDGGKLLYAVQIAMAAANVDRKSQTSKRQESPANEKHYRRRSK